MFFLQHHLLTSLMTMFWQTFNSWYVLTFYDCCSRCEGGVFSWRLHINITLLPVSAEVDIGQWVFQHLLRTSMSWDQILCTAFQKIGMKKTSLCLLKNRDRTHVAFVAFPLLYHDIVIPRIIIRYCHTEAYNMLLSYRHI